MNPLLLGTAAIVELTREIARRFNMFYTRKGMYVFPEPQPLLTPAAKLPGTDGRKMSKSYGNTILLTDPEPVVRQKLKTMVTDPARVRRTDPGNPDVCPVGDLHKVFSDRQTIVKVDEGCRSAGIGCIECKGWAADALVSILTPCRSGARNMRTIHAWRGIFWRQAPPAPARSPGPPWTRFATPWACRWTTKKSMAENLKIAPVDNAATDAGSALAPVVQMPASQKPKPESDFPFSVTVGDVYEGPLDLLLDLIRKQDIDIYDIPIARITAQYLAYVEKLRELDVNVAAEFIYMAAVLIHIKSKMLLPRDPAAASDAQDDPRAELVNRLIEHEKFKSAAQMLMQKQQIEEAVRSNPAIREFMDAEGTEPEIAADVIDLVKTFQQILERARSRPMLQVDEETVTVGQMIDYLQRRLALEDKPLRLKQILRNVNSHQALVCMFLALLEMVRLQAIQLRQDRIFGEILLRKHTGFEAIIAEQAAVRDDWR